MPTLPPDPIYTADLGAIGLNYDQTVAGINFDRTQLGQEYGFSATGGLDPTNPFSVAANLQRRYQQQQQGTVNSYAAGGQLYSGALRRQQGEDYYQYQRSYDSARRGAMRGYQDLTEQEQRAGFDRSRYTSEAESNRLGRLNPEDTVPTPAAAPAPTPATQRLRSGYRRRSTGFGQNRPTGTWGRR